MSSVWQKLKRRPLALAGGVMLVLFYGAALFAPFVAPYSEETEFREHFFHPPTRIHFRNELGQFVTPYVSPTYLVDSRKHLFEEGSPIRIACLRRDKNANPYIAETIEEDAPFAVIRSGSGETLGKIMTAMETSENSAIFSGQTTINLDQTGNHFIVEAGKYRNEFVLGSGEYVSVDSESGIHLLDEAGNTIDRYVPESEKFRFRFFARGTDYRMFGIFQTDLHLFGVDSPGRLFLLGTDQTGRDIFSRIIYGSRISLTVGLIGVFISTCLGLWIGGIAGFYGGKTDTVLMRFLDVLLSIPALYLILCVRNVFPTNLAAHSTYALTIVVLSLTGWASMARVIRGMVLSIREEEFVIAARALGASSMRILMKHILPNTFGYVMVRATLLIPAYILAEVTLSYLGLGIQEPVASWGNMLSAAQELRVLEQFSWILSPGIFLFLTVLAFNFLGDGLRDIESPDRK